MRVIGLMSGTSMDGIDVALVETDGELFADPPGHNRVLPEGNGSEPVRYTPAEAALLHRAKAEAQALTDRTARPGCLAEAEALVTRRHAEAVEAFMAARGLTPTDIDAVGFHGQTLVHRPAEGLTVQIGDGVALARRLGIRVVHDFRAADVASGGQGAPLVPVFHRALARASGFALPLAVLNIGGVANVTFLDEGDALAGFDTGPGNALLDDLMRARTGTDRDQDGATAAAGRVDEDLLAWLLAHPYFGQRPPKSLDRDAFSYLLVGGLTLPDAAATLSAFTVRAVARALDWAHRQPLRWIVAGGGAHNPVLMRGLREALGTPVETAESVGWSTDDLEAQAFAFLAARRLAGLPITYPATTGVAEPLTGGEVAEPEP